MTPGPAPRPPIRWTPVAAVLAIILVATLGRTELPPPGVRNVEWCFSCGSQWGIDFVLNIALFLPLGFALRYARAGRWRSAIIVVATTLAIELLQLVIPGRITSTGDLLANSIGGMLGWELGGQLLTILAPRARQAVALVLVAGAAVPAVFALTLWLFEPSPTPYPYWGQFAPTLGQFVKFHGRVIEASVGGEPLRNGRLPNSDAVRAALGRDGTVVEALVEPGTPTPALAPAVSIFDGRHNEVMLLGRDGDNLVFRLRTHAMHVGLRSPSVTVWNAYRQRGRADESRPVRISGRVDGYTISAQAGGDTAFASRTIEFRPTQGWAYLLPFENLYTERAAGFTHLWVTLLFAPLGYYAAMAAVRLAGAARRAAVLGWVILTTATALWGIPAAAGLSSGTPGEWRAGALGLAAGAVLGFVVVAIVGRRAQARDSARGAAEVTAA